MTRREELFPEIRRLREDEGLTWRKIGERLGLSLQTVHGYYTDPTGSVARARKASYSRPCLDCGKPLSGSDGNGPNAPVRCHRCASAQRKVWTPDAITAAIQRWADEHGGVPPKAAEWRASGPDHPPASAVIQTMGWANAIRAAGYDAFGAGKYGRDGEYPEVVAETVALYRSGLSATEVGKRQDVTPTCVLYRLQKAGEPRRPPGRYARMAA